MTVIGLQQDHPQILRTEMGSLITHLSGPRPSHYDKKGFSILKTFWKKQLVLL